MEITDAISLLIDSGFKIVPQHVEDWWKDIGKLEDILEANQLTLDGIKTLCSEGMSKTRWRIAGITGGCVGRASASGRDGEVPQRYARHAVQLVE
jgi:dTDP-glucose pyrophosphorylase